MKVSQILVASLALFALSLSVAKIAHADWEISSSSVVATGPDDYLFAYGSASYSESAIALGGGVNFGIDTSGGFFQVSRTRTIRTYYQWTGAGTPTTVHSVPVNWSITLSTNKTAYSSVGCTAGASINGTPFSQVVSVSDAYAPSPEIHTGSFVATLTYTSSTTAYIEVSWSYNGQIFSNSGNGGIGGGSATVGYNLSTPY